MSDTTNLQIEATLNPVALWYAIFIDFFFDLLPSFAVMLMFATAIIHICFATWVYADAQALVQERRDRQAVVFSPLLWLLAVLVTGIAGLAVYWAIHRSTLSPANLVETE